MFYSKSSFVRLSYFHIIAAGFCILGAASLHAEPVVQCVTRNLKSGAEVAREISKPSSGSKTVLDDSVLSWIEPKVFEERLKQAVSDQNQMRKKQNVDLLAKDSYRSNLSARPSFTVKSLRTIDYPTAGSFVAYGDNLVRGVPNDIYSLNRVYKYKGSKLVKSEPFGSWYLKQLPGATVTLYREMSPTEYALWENGKYEKLGTDWGHGTSVLHFSTDPNFTSAASGPNSPKIAIQVPKKVLMNWIDQKQAWSGILDQDKMISEIGPAFEGENEDERHRV